MRRVLLLPSFALPAVRLFAAISALLPLACSSAGESTSATGEGGNTHSTASTESSASSTPSASGGAGGSGPGSGGATGGAGNSGSGGAPPAIWSAPIEVCNGADDDGDGSIDEDCPPSLWAGAFPPGGGADLTAAQTTQRIESDSARPLPAIQTYHGTKPAGVAKIAADLAAIWAHGAIPHLNVEPSDYPAASYANASTDAAILADLNAMAAAVAGALTAHPEGRLLLTFGAEMNGNWTDWGCLSAASYVAFYRKAHDLVNAALAAESPAIDSRRARWVFGPNSTSSNGCGSAASYYPGAAYVDYLGMSAYRSGTQSVAAAVLDPAHGLTAALGYSGAFAADRFIVLQTGSRDEPNDDRGAWLGKLYSDMAADDLFLGAIYFNAADWAVLDATTPPAPLEGYDKWIDALKALPAADGRLDGTFEPFFWDVRVQSPYYAEIQSLRAAGLTSGCAAAPPSFCPEEGLSRAAAVIFAARAFGIAADEAGPPVFEDVVVGDAGYGEIQALAKLGVLAGCSATAFCPGEAMDRRALAVLLAGLSKPPAVAVGAGSFNDVTADDPAAAAIAALAALKRVDGCGGGLFCPDEAASRAAGAAWIVRSAGVKPAPKL